jgi:hypothetical protein
MTPSVPLQVRSSADADGIADSDMAMAAVATDAIDRRRIMAVSLSRVLEP